MPGPKELHDLLAPVPLVHLLSAIEDGMPSEVAFGSEKDQFFGKLGADVITGMRVWIYASKTGSANLDPAIRQRVCFVGNFGGSTEAGLSYSSLHEVRPSSAKTGDSSWIVLWLVRNLQSIDPPRFYGDFLSAKTKKPLAKEPAGPMLICPPTGWDYAITK
ncbi:MAG TPA: hypothetical protein VGG99_24025 [Acetobacteraceae bacterium]|jgi:hypothetical protein